MTTKVSEEVKLDWLRLIRSDHVGPRTFRALLNHCGGAAAALEALPDIARRGGAGATARVYSRENAERELAAMKAIGVSLLAIGEEAYPGRLAMIDDPPPLLAVRGNWPPWRCRWLRSSERAMLPRPVYDLRSGLRASSARPASQSPPGWRAASMLPHIAQAFYQERSPCSLEATSTSHPTFLRMARWFPRCRSAGSRAHAISPAAIGSFPV